MKHQRPTTPVYERSFKKPLLIAVASLMVIATPAAVFADRYTDQINQLEAEISGFEQQAAQLRSQADTLQNAIAALQAQQNAIQAKIDLNQEKLAQLRVKIKENEVKLAEQQQALTITLTNIYTEGQTSTIEIIAGSDSIGDYVDRQEYRSSIRNQVESSIQDIETIKKELDDQRFEVERTLSEQEGQKQQLVAKKQEQADLLAQTRNQESRYQALVSDREEQLQDVRAAQEAAYAAARASWGGGYISQGGSGGYAWAGQGLTKGCNGSCVDSWNLYKGQCVSYVAWKLDQAGYRVYGFDGMGNAAEWPSTTTSYWSGKYGAGNAAKVRYSPKAGYAAVDPSLASPYGHVMYVESVNGDGTVNISEYNFVSADTYSERRVSTSGLIFLEFARK